MSPTEAGRLYAAANPIELNTQQIEAAARVLATVTPQAA
jgi:hypothetical protein